MNRLDVINGQDARTPGPECVSDSNCLARQPFDDLAHLISRSCVQHGYCGLVVTLAPPRAKVSVHETRVDELPRVAESET